MFTRQGAIRYNANDAPGTFSTLPGFPYWARHLFWRPGHGKSNTQSDRSHRIREGPPAFPVRRSSRPVGMVDVPRQAVCGRSRPDQRLRLSMGPEAWPMGAQLRTFLHGQRRRPSAYLRRGPRRCHSKRWACSSLTRRPSRPRAWALGIVRKASETTF